VIEGDIADVPALPGDLDAVVHCAGDVSFNPPVNEAFTTNVVGTRGLLDRIREVGDHVHYVHVSTAYVAGRRRGNIPEGPVDHDVDLEADSGPATPSCSAASARRPSVRTAGPGCSPRPRRSRSDARSGSRTS
jgi:nucleoside-diphosphate-sugar epimerase